MTAVDPAAARRATEAVPSIPCDAEGPVFREPWEAQAFALTLSLYDRGLFKWPEWAAILGDEIKKAQAAGDPDTGETYYRHWLAALERIVAEKGVTDAGTLRKYYDAWDHAADRTPHGKPIELKPEDFVRISRSGILQRTTVDSAAIARRPDVLGPHAKAEEPRRNAAQHREPLDQPHDEQRRLRLARARQRRRRSRLFCTITCMRWVTRVGKSRRSCTCGEIVVATASCAQRLGQDVGGGDRVLHREVDADAADRRHRVRGVADAEQARPVPCRSRSTATVSSLTCPKSVDLADAVAQKRRSAPHASARNAASPSRCTSSMPPFGMT